MFIDGRFKRAVTHVLLQAFTLLSLQSCVTSDVSRQKVSDLPGGPSSVEVSVYGSPKASEAGTPFPGTVSTRLLRVDEGASATVQESTQSRFSIADLPPGHYRVEVLRWMDETGRLHEPKTPSGESFRVRSGEKVSVGLILSDKRGVGWSALGVGLGLVGVGLVIAFFASMGNSMKGSSFSFH